MPDLDSHGGLGNGTGKPAGIPGSTRTRTRGGCAPVPAGTDGCLPVPVPARVKPVNPRGYRLPVPLPIYSISCQVWDQDAAWAQPGQSEVPGGCGKVVPQALPLFQPSKA
ncbi:hypothetical protein GGX14DRAFT_383951 [Mycena pura]|uniref:Uncharacterized protein n=1 Tax=Mycena pura TaxID=153505 RepID=A0AAD6YUF4_9AGAR|nr:hypothetical protein GGX14DRAFT_383951 [Mycena pura]